MASRSNNNVTLATHLSEVSFLFLKVHVSSSTSVTTPLVVESTRPQQILYQNLLFQRNPSRQFKGLFQTLNVDHLTSVPESHVHISVGAFTTRVRRRRTSTRKPTPVPASSLSPCPRVLSRAATPFGEERSGVCVLKQRLLQSRSSQHHTTYRRIRGSSALAALAAPNHVDHYRCRILRFSC